MVKIKRFQESVLQKPGTREDVLEYSQYIYIFCNIFYPKVSVNI